MKFTKKGAELYIPDGETEANAFQRTTHMAIAAHQDDIEIMAYHGILACFGRKDKWFTGVVVTNGAGSPRDDLYAEYTDEQMQRIRKKEQKKSAVIGEYSAVALLDFTSAEVKDGKNRAVANEITEFIVANRPEVLYTHNPADKHDTHVAVTARVVTAIRALPEELRPEKLYGCEVWRGLDWVNDNEKILLDVSARPHIAAAVLGVHDSQISGGKRYDLATGGRRRANATYAQSHGTDPAEALTYGIDLTPLIHDDSLDFQAYVEGFIQRFEKDVTDRLRRIL